MPKLHITGWRPGLDKITAIKLLVEATSYGLKGSKDCIDEVLAGGQATIEVKDLAKAEALAAKLQEIGAVANVER